LYSPAFTLSFPDSVIFCNITDQLVEDFASAHKNLLMAFLQSRNNADTFVKSINGNVYYIDNTRDAYNADCNKIKEILIREGENSEQNDVVQTNSGLS